MATMSPLQLQWLEALCRSFHFLSAARGLLSLHSECRRRTRSATGTGGRVAPYRQQSIANRWRSPHLHGTKARQPKTFFEKKKKSPNVCVTQASDANRTTPVSKQRFLKTPPSKRAQNKQEGARCFAETQEKESDRKRENKERRKEREREREERREEVATVHSTHIHTTRSGRNDSRVATETTESTCRPI